VRVTTSRGPRRGRRPGAVSCRFSTKGAAPAALDITDAKLDATTHVDYTADRAEAIQLARDGKYQAAFLIAATTVEELQAVVHGGELLPQKSTHFYPKLLDGLVFSRLGE
jgi:uncharacterized protein (DUF1015 family)